MGCGFDTIVWFMATISSALQSAGTLWDVLTGPPADSTAIILPETDTRVTYGQLRAQIQEMAGALAALDVKPGERVATSLPNGLAAIVSFVAASMAGTAAPLNPGYRQEEVEFYLEDTSAKLLLVPAEGHDDVSIAMALSRANHRLSVTERIRRFILADEPFAIENEQLTPSLKIRRHVIRGVYGERLDALYKG